MSDGDDEYRFDPADVDEGAESGGFDAASAAVEPPTLGVLVDIGRVEPDLVVAVAHSFR